MAVPLRASDVVVGLLTENNPRMMAQAVRLLRSIRWFGDELSGARVVVCGVGPLAPAGHATLQSLGAEIRTVSRFHPANPTGNRHQLIAELLDVPQRVLLLLDCDTLVVRDPLSYIDGENFQAKIAPTPTVSDEVFDRLFAHFDLPKPARSHVTGFDSLPTIPYYNAGVLAMPVAIARVLAPSWRKYNLTLADNPELVMPNQRHMHQASLALALAETGVPCAELPDEMNYQINAPYAAAPPRYGDKDPVIIHYHHLGTDDGFLLPTEYRGAQNGIDMFHGRMRAEGFLPRNNAASDRSTESRPVVVLGMHRSGTSVVTEIITSMGSYAGESDRLMPADMFNPTGYWEHNEVVEINTEMLAAASLTEGQRNAYLARAKDIVRSLQGKASFVLKDPRMALLLPFWLEVLDNPVFVIAWRHPFAVARSLRTREKRPLIVGIAEWEHHTRTLLRETSGFPRVLLSYEELLREPVPVVRRLHESLTGFGISGLVVPSAERIAQMVNSDFNRSGGVGDESLLDADQRSLLQALRSGEALRQPVEATPARALAIIKEYERVTMNEATLRESINELDELLRATFASRSWRLGHALSRLGTIFRRRRDIPAVERWKESKRRRL